MRCARRDRSRAATTVAFLLGLAAAAAAQSGRDSKLAEYKKRVDRHHVEAAQAYVEIAWWGRKVGIVPQSTVLFLRAKEAGQGRHQMADNLVGWMDQLGDAFWRVRPKRPPRHWVVECTRKVRLADRQVRKSHLQVAELALGVGAEQDARTHCEAAIRLGAAIEAGKDGRWKLDGLLLPEPLAKWLQERTVATAGGARVYESAAAAGGPRLEGLHAVADERLAVRTDLGAETAKTLHALGSALLPHLEDRLDGAPARQLVLLVFGKRADFAGYLKSLGIEGAAAGLAEYGSFQTIVCAEGKSEGELHALVLHELSHLFFWGTAPAAMPDWYAEGFAESFGGQGTFSYDGKQLTIGGLMDRHRIEALQQEGFALGELLEADAEQLWQQDPAKALRFYAAAWALQRFLRSPGCRWKDEFERWEARCRGTVLGNGAGGGGKGRAAAAAAGGGPALGSTPRYGDRKPAQVLFREMMGKEFEALDRSFQEYVRGL